MSLKPSSKGYEPYLGISKATASIFTQKGLDVSFHFSAYTHAFLLVLGFFYSVKLGHCLFFLECYFILFHLGQSL